MHPSLKLRRQHVVSYFFFKLLMAALLISLKFLFFYLVLVELGVHCCCQAVSSCSARVSHRGGFSGCRAWALGSVGSVAPRHVKSSLTRDQTHASSGGFLTTGPAEKSNVLYLTMAIQQGVTQKQAEHILVPWPAREIGSPVNTQRKKGLC